MDGAPLIAIDANIARVADWVGRCAESTAEIARRADVDHKTVRLARLPGWNPTADVLRKFEKLIPAGWKTGDPIPSDAEAASAAAPEARP